MLLLLCVTVTVLPVSIAFYDELNPGWLTVNIITDTLFILDIVVNFRTGILVQTMYPQTVKGGVRGGVDLLVGRCVMPQPPPSHL